MARPKSALRQRLERVAVERAAEAATGSTSASTSLPTSNSTATATAAEDSDSPKIELAAELERLSALSPTQYNRRNWSLESPEWKEMMDHLAPDFVTHWNESPRPLTFVENLAAMRAKAEGDPSFHMELTEINVDVDEGEGIADVHVHLRAGGGGIVQPGMYALRWERNAEGKWLCVRSVGYRSMNAGSI